MDKVAVKMKLGAIWGRISPSRRQPTSIQLFSNARRHRDEGRFEEAAQIVARGLVLEPRSIVGRLLAAHLHLVFRDVAAAIQDFEAVLSLDPEQPRALLGLARIAFEEGDAPRCRELLARALRRYPDFPEAQVLLDAIPAAADRAGRQAPGPHDATTLEPPATSTATIVMRHDALVFAAPPDTEAARLAEHTVRVERLAGALLSRVGYARLERAEIHAAGTTTYLRRDTERMLSTTFPTGAAAEAEVERFWRVVGTVVRAGTAQS